MTGARAAGRSSYDGVAVAVPVTVPYRRYSTHGAHWWIGRAMDALVERSGIAKEQIDGLTVSSFSLVPDTAVGVTQHLGLSPRWLDHIPTGGASGVMALRRAARAVQAGDADVVACVAADANHVESFRQMLGGFSHFARDASYPYGSGGPNSIFAFITAAYMRAYGAVREDFGRICVAQRANALKNPNALFKVPLTIEQYLDARPISDPIHLFDCVMPCAGAEAFLVMREERAQDLGLTHVLVRGAIERHNAYADDPVLLRGGWRVDRDDLYAQAGVRPDAIDFVQTYDDYPVVVMLQFEDLGFCEKGDGPAFVRARTLTHDGDFPNNTSGGQLSAGQAGCAGGFLGMTEAIRQLTDAAGERAVRAAQVGLVSGFGMVTYDRCLCTGAVVLLEVRVVTMPLMKPRRKNPVLRTRQMNLPPFARGRTALGMTAAAAEGRFALQVCRRCKAVQYPPRDACHVCLSGELHWTPQDGAGALLSETVLHHSNDPFYRERLPWRLGLVHLDAGPTVIVHLHGDVAAPPAFAAARAAPPPQVRVHVGARLDRAGAAVLIGFPAQESEHMADDKMLREMTSDPKFRKVLVTDGKTEVGQALVQALVKAGAEIVWVGHAEPWKKLPGLDDITKLAQVTLVPLDLTNGRSVSELAGEIGGKVDIVINNAEVHRAFGIAARRGTDVAKAEMDINYFGLLRLAQEFGPALKARSADGETHAAAWVNLLSIYALSNYPPHGTFSASKAAAHSLAQCLRAEMRSTGIRVINVFPGPIDDEWNQNLPPPKVAPAALASAIVKALKEGIEDVYPGDVAQEWVERWRENPKVLERELAAG